MRPAPAPRLSGQATFVTVFKGAHSWRRVLQMVHPQRTSLCALSASRPPPSNGAGARRTPNSISWPVANAEGSRVAASTCKGAEGSPVITQRRGPMASRCPFSFRGNQMCFAPRTGCDVQAFPPASPMAPGSGTLVMLTKTSSSMEAQYFRSVNPRGLCFKTCDCEIGIPSSASEIQSGLKSFPFPRFHGA